MNGAELTSISLTILLLGFVVGLLAGSRMWGAIHTSCLTIRYTTR